MSSTEAAIRAACPASPVAPRRSSATRLTCTPTSAHGPASLMPKDCFRVTDTHLTHTAAVHQLRTAIVSITATRNRLVSDVATIERALRHDYRGGPSTYTSDARAEAAAAQDCIKAVQLIDLKLREARVMLQQTDVAIPALREMTQTLRGIQQRNSVANSRG